LIQIKTLEHKLFDIQLNGRTLIVVDRATAAGWRVS